MSKSVCILCGNTGITCKGEMCECKKAEDIDLPIIVTIPSQYQGIKFSKEFVIQDLRDTFGKDMEIIINSILNEKMRRNLLVCSPPSTGKTIFAYTVVASLFSKGIRILPLMDLIEARDILFNHYKHSEITVEQFNKSRLLFIKIPLDLPIRFPETIITIVERRVRNNSPTIFLYNGTVDDLKNQDKYNKLNNVLNTTGLYNTIKVLNYSCRKEKEDKENK